MVTLRIHAGGLSLDNGAWGPRRVYFDMAKLFQVPADTGGYDGDDRITINEADLPIAEELLQHQSMLYRVEGRDQDWKNVRTEHVANRLRHSPHLH